MPKAHRKSGGDTEEGHDPHRVINPKEARSHVDVLDETMEMIQAKMNTNKAENIADTAIERIKATLASTLSMMEDASMTTVVKAIKDCSFKVLLPRSDEVDQMLEEVIPMEEIPQAADVIRVAEATGPLIENDQRLLGKLFNALEVAHEQLAMACSTLGRLSRTLKPEQLLLVIKTSI